MHMTVNKARSNNTVLIMGNIGAFRKIFCEFISGPKFGYFAICHNDYGI